jgi:hypothetical protein
MSPRPAGGRHLVLRAGASALIVLSSLWALLALWHQLPGAGKLLAPGLWSSATLSLLVLLWRGRPRVAIGLYLALFIALQLWWHSLTPSHQRHWAADVAELSHGHRAGDRVTLYNVRNFSWRSATDFSARWETRHYDLQQLTSVDLLTSYWAGPAIAHTLISFGFADGQFVTFSVEIRREAHETFSETGGFFKMFELSVVAADERDIIGVRTNVRGEEVYLYRLNLTPASRRALLLAYIDRANNLRQTPAFYHTVTANCTTIVFDMMRQIVQRLPVDYRLLLSGYLPAYAFDAGGLMPGHSLTELHQRGHINARATAAQDHFSTHIRQGVPGWE